MVFQGGDTITVRKLNIKMQQNDHVNIIWTIHNNNNIAFFPKQVGVGYMDNIIMNWKIADSWNETINSNSLLSSSLERNTTSCPYIYCFQHIIVMYL